MANLVALFKSHYKRISGRMNQALDAAVADSVDSNDLEVMIQDIKGLYRRLDEIFVNWEDKYLEGEVTPEKGFMKEKADFEEQYNDKICKLAIQKRRLAANQPQSRDTTNRVNKIKLPPIKLVEFSGKPETWQNFWQSFKAHIHDDDSIPNVTKYQFLTDQLSGCPKKIVGNFSATDAGYTGAIKSLCQLYDNPKQQRNIMMDKFLNLKGPVNTHNSLLEFRVQLEGLQNQLEALGVNTTNPLNSRIIQNKIPHAVLQKVYLITSIYPSVEDIMKSIEVLLERNDFGDGKVESTSNPKPGTSSTKPYGSTTVKIASTTPQQQKGCVYCGGGHKTWRCTMYTDLPSRKAQLSKLGRCVNCCRIHTGQCLPLHPCNLCKQAHHTWLHLDEGVKKVHTGTFGVVGHTATALPTALLRLLNKPNKRSQSSKIQIRALLDQGSQRTFITQDAVNRLNLKPVKQVTLDLSGFLATRNDQVCDVVKPVVRIGQRYRKIDAIVLKDLNTRIVTPGLKATAETLRNMGVKLADSYKADTVSDINLLIGGDHYYKFVDGFKRVQDVNLLLTPQGCIVTGPLKVPDLTGVDVLSITVCKIGSQNPLDRLDFEDEVTQTHKLWELDNLGIRPKDEISVEASLSYSEYLRTVEYTNGQYWVKLPFKTDRPDLPNNYKPAIAQLRSLVRKLGTIPENLLNYDKIIRQYLSLGFVETVPVEAKTNEIHYLPHHGVMKDSVSTPLRIVFNASSKMRGTSSLNDCLMTGPNLTEKLGNTLLKFRSGKYGYTADISKAFLRIGLQREHRDYCRFLWLKDLGDESSPLIELRFKSVLFGATSSPFLLQATLDYHFDHAPDSIRDIVKRGFYVDNFLGSSDDLDQLSHLYLEVNKLLKTANMPLQQWTSNSHELKNLIRATEDPVDEINVLGLNWDTLEDNLTIKTPKWDDKPLTKRRLLSRVSSVFDPLGLITPITINGRMLIRKAWLTKLDWDEPLPLEFEENWEVVQREFSDLEQITFPRTTMSKSSVYNLHVFCDASKLAYGAVAYVEQHGEINLLTSKAKVAPIKERTLPQMELTALLIGARLVKHVVDTLDNCQVGEVFVWSDNEPCLQWVKNDKSGIVYVKNRVSEIVLLQEDYNFKLLYVPTKCNPADLLSRGVSRSKLEHTNWFKGPDWLNQVSKWPIQKEQVVTLEISTEIQPEIQKDPPFIKVQDYSDWTYLIRVTKTVLKFINNIKQKLGHPILNMTPAQYLFLQSQKEHYPLIRLILKGETTQPKHHPCNKMIKDLGLFIDNQDLIRCRGRLEFAEVVDGAKLPYLISGKADVTKLWVQYSHVRWHHIGVNETLVSTRQIVWIPKGRQVIKGILKHCVTCNRIQGPLLTQPGPPPLPFSRTNLIRPFRDCGVDYTGAILIKDADQEHRQVKVYVCLFTCMASRAVHLEIAKDNSASTFVNLLRRFIAEHGVPHSMTSDNGSNFVATAAYLKTLAEEPQVVRLLDNMAIKWNFIHPRSPWEGGFYERLIGVVKNGLRKAMYSKSFFYDDIVTLLKEIQNRVNNRPLTFVGAEDPCLEPLTPNHLIKGRRIDVLPPVILVDEDDPMYNDPEYLQQGYSKMSKLIERFKVVWQRDYLTALREKHSTVSMDQVVPVKVNDIVLVENSATREQWPLARVTKLLPDCRGQVRAVEVLVDGQLLIKTLNKLVNLEVRHDLELETPVINFNDSSQEPGNLIAGTELTLLSNNLGPTRTDSQANIRPRREAATRARDLFQTLGHQDLI